MKTVDIITDKIDNLSQKLLMDRERLKIALFSLLAVCIVVVSLLFFALSINRPFMGVTLALTPQGWKVDTLDADGIAVQAGIKIGDIPVEINGQPAGAFLEKYTKTGSVTEIVIKKLTVADASGQLKSVNLDKSPANPSSQVSLLTWFIISLIFWATGFYVFFKRPKNPAAILLCLSGLALGLTLAANAAGERLVPIAAPLTIVAAVIGPWLLLHFFMVLPEERIQARNNPLIYLIYLPAIITLILFPLIGYADGQPVPWFRTFRLLEYGAGFLAAVGAMIFNYLHASSSRTRQQMKIILISCLVALIPFIFLGILPATIWEQNVVPSPFYVLFFALIPIGLGYAVVTRKLMDIDIVIRRSVVYGSITVLMAFILSAAIFPVLDLQKSLRTSQEIVLALVLGGVATALFGPAKKGIEFLVDKLFYKDRYDYRQTIHTLNASLNTLNELSDISRVVVGTAVKTLHLAGACLFVRQDNRYVLVTAAQGTLDDANKQNRVYLSIVRRNTAMEFPNSASAVNPDLAFLIPLTAGEKPVGFLCLSPKVSREGFSHDDMYLIQGLASSASAALRSSLLIHEVSARDTFVGIASHEINTSLAAILGYSELMLKREYPPATRKKWLANIADSARKLNDMANNLLNTTRIQTGQITMHIEPVKLAELIESPLSLVRENTSIHKFVNNIDPGLPEVMVDRDKFSQVVSNLLNNAVKYSPKGGTITISSYHDPSKHRVVLSISDQGIGISPKDQNWLFKTFHRIQRPETTSIRGSGLGLYIVKEWMERMKGEVWLESELDRGSTFFVSVPANSKS